MAFRKTRNTFYNYHLQTSAHRKDSVCAAGGGLPRRPQAVLKGRKTAAPAMSKQLLFIVLHRGPNGLGLELDATNTVVNMIAGGAAEVQGYFCVGDTIASVDGTPLRGRLLRDVMDRHKNSYSFDVWPNPNPNLALEQSKTRAREAAARAWWASLASRRSAGDGFVSR